MEKIAVLDTGYESYEYEEKLFTSNGFRFVLFPGEGDDEQGKLAFASDAAGILVRWTEIGAPFLHQAPRLRAIVRYGAGYENIDLRAASAAGIKVSNVRGYGNHAVSDHALTLMYACARGLVSAVQGIRTNFGAPPFRNIPEFHQCTLGIVGLGRIGGTLSLKARGLFGDVVAFDPYIDAARFRNHKAHRVSLEKLLEESDCISLHCNLTEETRNMIDKTAFSQMKKTPILINTARGPIIDNEALLSALRNQQICAAGIDVHNTEIAEQLPEEIIHHPKIVATGHYAWYSAQSHVRLQQKAANNLLKMLHGQIPEDCLNP